MSDVLARQNNNFCQRREVARYSPMCNKQCQIQRKDRWMQVLRGWFEWSHLSFRMYDFAIFLHMKTSPPNLRWTSSAPGEWCRNNHATGTSRSRCLAPNNYMQVEYREEGWNGKARPCWICDRRMPSWASSFAWLPSHRKYSSLAGLQHLCLKRTKGLGANSLELDGEERLWHICAEQNLTMFLSIS
jgi:hypothetical protein